MEDCKLSIIIPAYNAEATLIRCVESCENQGIDLSTYEIIIIDDGSYDRTYHEALEIAGNFPNVKVFTQTNQGQSVARNKGLDIAKGNFIMFVDADDYLKPLSLKDVLQFAEVNNVEVCSYLMEVCDANGNKYHKAVTAFEQNRIYKGEKIMLKDNQAGSCCCCLYSLKFLNENKLRFYTGIVHQDIEFTTRAYSLTQRMTFTNKIVYVYDYNSNSTTRAEKFEKVRKSVLDNIYIAESILHFAVNNRKLSEQLKHFLIQTVSSSICGILISFIKDKNKSHVLIHKEFLHLAVEHNLYPIKSRALSWKMELLRPILNSWFYRLWVTKE